MTVHHPAPAALALRPDSVLTLIGMLAAVAGVLVLTYFATRWIAKRGSPTGGLSAGGSGDERLQVLCMLNLGREERLALVRLGERCLLLGVASGGVTLLRELSEEEAQQWLAPGGDGTSAPPSFWDVVKKNLPKRK